MAVQSLYRRYRPRRFGELRGQDHVVRALREAVAGGRVGQAYLFSGPRGTGKTTSARVLAKALNCDHVVDGEPCCECESCLAVEHGTSYDVHELDAASNNGVDGIRDLVEKASLGTPGRHKVYILDEVHMLSRAAEAALLKTLEEPPPHVVFVLATTDPQRMSDTIRSRTQHLQFHLLPADELAEHVRWVATDAGYDLPESAIDAALARGAGSARDALSALELIAATGGDVNDRLDLDEFVEALVDHDAGRALTAMANAVSMGVDARTVCDELVRALRDGFLSLMAPELVLLPPDRVDELAERSRRYGTARLVRAIERLGTVLVEMRHAPDPRILADVALVQLAAPPDAEPGALGDDVDARLVRLERRIDELAARPAAPSVPTDPATGRAVLGGAAASPRTVPAATSHDDTAVEAASSADGAPPAPVVDEPVADEPPGDTAEMSVVDAWNDVVRPSVKPFVRALYSGGSFVGEVDGRWQFEVATEPHAGKCDKHRAEIEAALSEAVGRTISIELVVAGQHAAPTTAGGAAERTETTTGHPDETGAPAVELPADDEVDLSELTDAPPESVKTPLDRLAEAFPGSELVEGD